MPYICVFCWNVCIVTIDNLIYVVFVATCMVNYVLTWYVVYVFCVVGGVGFKTFVCNCSTCYSACWMHVLMNGSFFNKKIVHTKSKLQC
jgi:hypothetical protein